MIPIAYTGDLSAYESFCDNFKKSLAKIIKRGYVGNRKKTSVGEARAYMASLAEPQKSLYMSAVGDKKGNWTSLQDSDIVEAPKEMMDDESETVLKWFLACFDLIVDADDSYMKFLMLHARYFMMFKFHDRKKVYDTFYKVVVEDGYESSTFPKKELIKATNTRVCPYCNRIFVECVDSKQKVVKGQLDHFYPKEKYPYLALSKYNLVPSCSYCNGGTGKHNTDSRIKELVNPFFMTDIHSLTFKADVPKKGFLNLKTIESAISIKLDTSLCPDMANNVEVFNLMALYNTHLDYASEVYYKYMKMKTKAYRDFVRSITRPSKDSRKNIVKQMTEKDLERVILGIYSDQTDQARRPLSKFLYDLYEDFKRKGY